MADSVVEVAQANKGLKRRKSSVVFCFSYKPLDPFEKVVTKKFVKAVKNVGRDNSPRLVADVVFPPWVQHTTEPDLSCPLQTIMHILH